MKPPDSGVTVRMYRHGHGDCFLLAFRGDGGKPFYMLIDCGMKKGSQVKGEGETNLCDMPDVAKDIDAATGGHLNLVVITHEHEDHVSGFLSEEGVFSTLTIDALWLAWTDEPGFKLADDLRKKYHDVLLGLIAAAGKLNKLAAGDPSDAHTEEVVNALLDFDLPDPADRGLAAAPGKIAGITNKRAIKVVADRAKATEYLHPHTAPRTLPALPGVRFFTLGPPENEARLKDMDPKGEEEFHLAAAEERSFVAAVAAPPAEAEAHQPFAFRYRIPAGELPNYPAAAAFFGATYGPADPAAATAATAAPAWRRIDGDWLRSSETFALRMSNLVNNTSLVLAIELPRTKKVLLFVGDAQRGNWVSWHEKACPDGAGGEVTATDLLGRTVFYKVGHHGSHNATMNKGGLHDMAQKKFADQFVAMIPAHQKWAEALHPPWMHPLKEIEAALRKKARGRVFIADRVLEAPPPRSCRRPSGRSSRRTPSRRTCTTSSPCGTSDGRGRRCPTPAPSGKGLSSTAPPRGGRASHTNPVVSVLGGRARESDRTRCGHGLRILWALASRRPGDVFRRAALP